METILNQSISIGQLSQYVLTPGGIFAIYALVLYVFRKKISNLSMDNDPGLTYQSCPLGKGFAWTYFINVVLIYCILKLIYFKTGDAMFEYTSIILLVSFITLLTSPLSVWLSGFAVIATSLWNVINCESINQIFRKIIS